ncbi:hypothetical protein DICPUDRAFT_155627 [Dictyostelium purpureum]|uniref:N(6)-L-threonylcarbamoyladenine synthase n=1 Tax=Dictyostelium purpureum TaxID=5786 RepID=F0ZUH7_DICPU|nr:uncharacterized protein DICPUDRAFT_155627 [Dictyostelium purpureum]EGC32384.1 hypothetical protein DICPUDRAFT_155627 [Dictyostelium purpureum]|eukprot:XP_003291070.1 hypothetical protein DICPUDRAFT_155627 [Dictyostelium purpureum]
MLRNLLTRFNIFKFNHIKVLGIETSCDDTSVAIIDSSGHIYSESTKDQWKLHKEHRGIVPIIASEAHEKNIDFVVEDALKKSNLAIEDINYIAVTTGPGLSRPLKVGAEKAVSISKKYNIPIFSVNHLEGHSLVVRMENKSKPEFPFLILLVSGGHSQILICKGVGEYQLIGNTLDESVGEALDKAARSLGCEFGEVNNGENIITNIHGGQAIEILAKKGDPNNYPLTLPLLASKNCDFSFSGLRSSFDRTINKVKSSYNKKDDDKLTKIEKIRQNNQLDNSELYKDIKLTLKDQFDLAASFQNTAFKHLEHRIYRSLKWYYGIPEKKDKRNKSNNEENSIEMENPQGPPLNGIVVSGGVSKNEELRNRLTKIAEEFNLPIYFPKPSLCTDNGVMIAWAGVEMYNKGCKTTNPDQIFTLPVWPLDKNPQPLFRDINLDEKEISVRKRWYLDAVEKYGNKKDNADSNNNINK